MPVVYSPEVTAFSRTGNARLLPCSGEKRDMSVLLSCEEEAESDVKEQHMHLVQCVHSPRIWLKG